MFFTFRYTIFAPEFLFFDTRGFLKKLSLFSNRFRILHIFAKFFAFGQRRRIFVEYHSIKPYVLCFLVEI